MYHCAQAFRLRSPFASEVLADIQNARRAANATVLDSAGLLRRYPAVAGNNTQRVAHLLLTSSRGALWLDSASTPLVLLFTSEDCGVCRRFIPDVLKTLADSRVVCRVVVVSREGVESARRDFGAAVEVAALTSELALGLSVRGYPDVLVVRSGRVLHRQEGISPTTGRQLVDLLR